MYSVYAKSVRNSKVCIMLCTEIKLAPNIFFVYVVKLELK